MAHNVSIQNASSEPTHTAPHNTSLHGDCIQVIFGQMEFLPWDNPDNIASAEAEAVVRRIRDNFLVLLFLIGGPANVINMTVFYKQGLRDRVNLCLFALAVADGVYMLGVALHYGEQLYLQFVTQDTFGPAMTWLTNHNMVILLTGFNFVSPVLSTVIAIERCLCVVYPLQFQRLLRTRTMAAIIVVVYIVVLGLTFVVVFRYRIGCVHDPTSGIVVKTGVQGEFYKAHKQFIDHMDSFVFGVGLPTIEMLAVTTTTLVTIVKLRQAATWRSETSASMSPREVALTKMLVGNSLLFIACFSFIALNRLCWLFFPEINSGRRQQNFYLIGLWVTEMCASINATFNIFIYYSMGSRYREMFWALFGKRRKKPEQA